MTAFFTTVRYDYVQRTRSYAFLITLCASLAIAYTFVPEPNANYSTLRIGDYLGDYNAAWFGYVTAIMTSVFLSLIGFYLINSGIRRDQETKIGQIIGTTPTSNLKYLIYKTASNFLVLFTIVCMVFLMSIVLFFLYNDGFPFEPLQFIKPYLIITIPAIGFIATLAVVFEVLFGKYTILQNIGFFFLFSMLMFYASEDNNTFSYDVFGTKIVVSHMEQQVQQILNTDDEIGLNIGYVIGTTKNTKRFQFNGIDFPVSFLTSRLIWMLCPLLLLAGLSRFFHRFDKKIGIRIKKQSKLLQLPKSKVGITLSTLPKANKNYSMIPLLKTELKLLIKKGKKWHWILPLTGMVLMVVLPIKLAHQMVLPIVWFLQVGRLSDITLKEQLHTMQSFAFTSYKPLQRLLVSQLLSGIVLVLFLALPLLIRYAVLLNFSAILTIVLGGILIVVSAVLLGMVSQGKKLFEVLFFMITYININGIAIADYFGGFEHSKWYILQLTITVLIVGTMVFLLRERELSR